MGIGAFDWADPRKYTGPFLFFFEVLNLRNKEVTAVLRKITFLTSRTGIAVTIQYSEAPLVRRIIDPTTHWSEAPLVRRNKISFNEDYKVIT